MKDNLVADKSFDFAVRIVNLHKYLIANGVDYSLAKQLLRCGTSIGANVVEAAYGISRKDFLAKNYIALKECAETIYWLELLHETGYLTEQEFNSIHLEAVELSKILSSITKTARENPEETPNS